jgi:hypothetical protein
VSWIQLEILMKKILNWLKNKKKKDNFGFYDEDIWKEVSNRLFPKLEQGITATGEVFGFTSTGKYIQKGYDYACPSGELGYTVFNLTYTSPDGNVFTFSHPQLVEYCRNKNIPMPPIHYYGKAKDLFPEISTETHWHENFLNKLCETYLEKDCKICRNTVPDEGICLRIDKPNAWKTLKLKSLRFLSKESESLDAGDVGIEETNNEE